MSQLAIMASPLGRLGIEGQRGVLPPGLRSECGPSEAPRCRAEHSYRRSTPVSAIIGATTFFVRAVEAGLSPPRRRLLAHVNPSMDISDLLNHEYSLDSIGSYMHDDNMPAPGPVATG
jgi:hypothetical protein